MSKTNRTMVNYSKEEKELFDSLNLSQKFSQFCHSAFAEKIDRMKKEVFQ